MLGLKPNTELTNVIKPNVKRQINGEWTKHKAGCKKKPNNPKTKQSMCLCDVRITEIMH